MAFVLGSFVEKRRALIFDKKYAFIWGEKFFKEDIIKNYYTID